MGREDDLGVAPSAGRRQPGRAAPRRTGTRVVTGLCAATLSIVLTILIVDGSMEEPVAIAEVGVLHTPAERALGVAEVALSRSGPLSSAEGDGVQRSFESSARRRNGDDVALANDGRGNDGWRLDPEDGYSTQIEESSGVYLEVYGPEMMIGMAESGDRGALLQASMIGSLPFEQRRAMAIAAAQQGHTSALTRLGGYLLIKAGRIPLPSQMDGELSLDAEDAIQGWALMNAARDLDDSGATAWIESSNAILSAAEKRLAVPVAEAIVQAVNTESLSDLLDEIES